MGLKIIEDHIRRAMGAVGELTQKHRPELTPRQVDVVALATIQETVSCMMADYVEALVKPRAG